MACQRDEIHCAVCHDPTGTPSRPYECKTVLCDDCIRSLRSQGYRIRTIGQLVTALQNATDNDLKETLDDIGYEPCSYPNQVDIKHHKMLYRIHPGWSDND